MTLEPVAGDPGHWRAHGADHAAPGVHALIIGVSEYPYLVGGRQQRPNAMGMQQLAVSASGPAKVFEWLSNAGRLSDRPIISCRLLLAPNAAPTDFNESELELVQSITDGWYDVADFVAIARAAKAWGMEFFDAPAESKADSAALFLFSGHGFEVLASPTLLARDFDPGSPFQNAVAYKSILDFLPTYGVGDGFFLFDCCRNAPDIAQKLNLTGRDVLEPWPWAPDGPGGMMWLKATDANARAYQDAKNPARCSFLVQAVLEALEGMPPDQRPYARDGSRLRLIFEGLEGYCKQRVGELLELSKSAKVQSVKAGGDPYEAQTLIAERRLPPAGGPDERVRGVAEPMIAPNESDSRQAGDVERDTREARESMERRSEALLSRFTTADPTREPAHAAHDLAHEPIMHWALQHEHFTLSWLDMIDLRDVATGRQLEPYSVAVVGGRASEDDMTAWLDLMVTPALGRAVWIALNKRGWRGPTPLERSLAVLIPRDQDVPTPVRLEITYSKVDDYWQLAPTGLSARIGPTDWDMSREVWFPIWEAQRTTSLLSLGQAATELTSLHVFERALQSKARSPLAAAVGAAALLEAGALDQLHDWPHNLADWFPIAEGPILWTETLLRRQRRAADWHSVSSHHVWWEDPATVAAAESFIRVNDRGPPRLTPVLGFAADQARLFQRRLIDLRDDNLEQQIQSACAAILAAAEGVGSEGLFLQFASTKVTLAPHPAFQRQTHGEFAGVARA